MLTRKHIFVEDWQYEYIVGTSERIGISVSEIIRGELSMFSIEIAACMGFETEFTVKGVMEMMKTAKTHKEVQKIHDNLLHESMRAINYRKNNNGTYKFVYSYDKTKKDEGESNEAPTPV